MPKTSVKKSRSKISKKSGVRKKVIPGEEWRLIPGFPGYEISNMGRVRSFKRRGGHGETITEFHFLSSGRKASGAVFVSLHKNGKQHSLILSRLVLKVFVGPPLFGQCALHWNDIPTDNRVENLRWGSRIENSFDRYRNGSLTRVLGKCPHCGKKVQVISPKHIKGNSKLVSLNVPS